MQYLTIKSKSLTASQYIAKNTHARNKQACKRIELREAAFRAVCYTLAAVGFSVAGGCLIQSILLFNQ